MRSAPAVGESRGLARSLRDLWAPAPEPAGRARIPFAGVLLAVAAVLVARRPGALIKPDLWAEDGVLFFRDQLVHGFPHTLTIPAAGYIYLLPRLVAGAAMLLPLSAVPLAYGIFSLALGAVACAWFARPEFRRIIPSDGLRVAASLGFAAIPTAWEIIGNITNLQWYLLWLAYLLTVSPFPRTAAGRAAFGLTWVVVALSGPTAMFLLPALVTRAVLATDPRERVAFAACAALPLIAALALRPAAFGGTEAPARWFTAVVTLVGWRMLGEAFVGETDALGVSALGPIVPVVIATIIVLAIAVAARFGTGAIRSWLAISLMLLVLYIAGFVRGRPGLLAAPLAKPVAFGGGRYFWVPANLVVLVFFVALSVTPARRRVVYAPVLAMLLAVAGATWQSPPMPPFPTRHWSRNMKRLQHAMRAEETCGLTIPVNPDGWAFRVHLVRGRPVDDAGDDVVACSTTYP
jgi:hypothetical protein